VIPAYLDRRLHDQELDFPTRHLAKVLARELEGRPPLLAASRLRGELCEAWGRESIERALVALDRAGYGRSFPRKPRRLRGHGARLEERDRLKGLIGKLPRAIALRLPTTTNNLLYGRRDGRDVWGEVRCNLTLRDGVLGLLAIAGGLWVTHSKPGERHVDLTAGEAAYLLRAKRRASRRSSGRDIAVYAELAQLSTRELDAEGGGDGHEIPSSPVNRVLRKLDGEWVTLTEYVARVEQGARPATGARDTIRIELADWFIDELRHSKRRPVLIDFCVWRQLRPLARRLYAMLQATGRSEHDPDRLYVWFAPVARSDGKRAGARAPSRWASRPCGWTRSRRGSGRRSRSCARSTSATMATAGRSRTGTPPFPRSQCASSKATRAARGIQGASGERSTGARRWISARSPGRCAARWTKPSAPGKDARRPVDSPTRRSTLAANQH
jgi:hypothetical protein